MDEVKYLPQQAIQRLFNETQYPTMITDGSLTPEFLRDAHLREPETRGEPPCTRSQMIRYRDQAGQWRVEVHQYLRPNKTLGARGRPDPKRVRVGNTVFIVDTQRSSHQG